MMAESDVLFAVVLFAATGQRTVRRIIAPFPDRRSALAFARENGLRCFTIGPMHFAVPTTMPIETGRSHPTRPAVTATRVNRSTAVSAGPR